MICIDVVQGSKGGKRSDINAWIQNRCREIPRSKNVLQSLRSLICIDVVCLVVFEDMIVEPRSKMVTKERG